jgi:hypothetical protein
VSTHLDGAPPSMADPDDEDPDDGDLQSSEFDDGSHWVRVEIERRMAANRSTRGRHARRGDAAAGPAERHARDVVVPDTRHEPAPPLPPPPAVPLPPPGFAAAGDLPENYVPRHSVQTPGPAAEPAEPVSGPIPIVRPATGDDTSGTPLGGPSLPPTGIPLPVRKKRSGPGTPLQVGGPATGPWSRPSTSIVPNEPVQRLGAPPGRLGAGEPLPPWGVPASPPRGFPAARDAHPAVGSAEVVESAAPDTDGAATDDDELVAGDTVPTAQVTDHATDLDAPVVDRPAAPPVAPGGAASTPAPAAVTPTGSRDLAEVTTTTLPVVGGGASPPARLVGIPVQRASGHRNVAPRPATPRHVPVVGTAPPEPGSTRVRVVLSERKGVARPVRTIKEVQEGTAVGDLLRRDLIRSQLKVTLLFALLTVFVLGSLPAVLLLFPEVGRFHVLGLRVPWLLLGLLVYPFLVGVAWRYTRVSDRVEQNFADHVQD